MATRRMLSKEITESDAFREMPLSSQALYLHYSMEGDDDGVVNNPKSIQRSIGASEDDLRILIAKRFIIPIEESGIIVIKHWKLNNYIQKDRYTPSKYQEELSLLGLDENNCYTANKTVCIQNGYTGKDSIDKNRLDKNNTIQEKIHTQEEPVKKNKIPTYQELKDDEEFNSLPPEIQAKILRDGYID